MAQLGAVDRIAHEDRVGRRLDAPRPTLTGRRLPIALGSLAVIVFAAWYWNPAYRYDEYLAAVARAELSWHDLLATIVKRDPAPGLLYVLMKPWTAISNEPGWTRIPSILAMTGCVVAFAVLVRRLVDTPTAVVAGILLVALPGVSLYAQDNRMYALATAMSVAAVYGWLRYLETRRLGWGALYVAALAAAGWFHLYTATIAGVLVVASLWQPGDRRDNLVRTIAPAAVAAVILLPHLWLNVLHPTGSPANPPLALYTIVAIVGLNYGYAAPVVAVLAALGCLVGVRHPRYRAAIALGTAWVLVPLALFIAARVVLDMPTLTARYLLFTLPGACMVAAIGLAPLRRRWGLAPAFVILLVVALVLPTQIQIRSVEGHSAATVRLGKLLRTAPLDGLPVVADTSASDITVGTATYPERRLAPTGAEPQPVALVVTRRLPPHHRDGIDYLRKGSSWRSVMVCTFGTSVHLLIVARPDAALPEGSPATLASRLNALVPRAGCTPVP